jgi:MFS family permease
MQFLSGLFSGRVFYGWYVVYAIAVVMTATSGLAFYNLPVLLDAFVTQRGFPVSVASSATATFFIAAGVAGVVAGQLVDRFDPRYVIIGSAILSSLALLSIGVLTEPWHLFAFYILFGLSYGGCGLVPTTTLVARWFERRRAFALSIAATGLSLGGVILTPLSALLILNLGLAGAAPWIALAFFLGVAPVTYWVVRASPESIGLVPDGEEHDERTGPKPVAHYIPLAQVWRSRFFIAVAATFLFALGAQVGAISHVYRLANTRVGVEVATVAVAILAVSSLVGRLAVGWLLLRISSRSMTFLLMISQTLALAIMAFAQGANYLLFAVTLFGLNTGSMLMMQPLLLAEAFGVRDYGRVYSISQLVGVFGYALGPAVAGFLYEATGSYTIPYLAIAASSFLGMVIFAFAGPTKQVALP